MKLKPIDIGLNVFNTTKDFFSTSRLKMHYLFEKPGKGYKFKISIQFKAFEITTKK